MGAHSLENYASYQSTSHHVNTDVNDNDDSHSFETPNKINCISSCFYDTTAKATAPNLSKLPPPGKDYLNF